jgi:hypothetical protein
LSVDSELSIHYKEDEPSPDDIPEVGSKFFRADSSASGTSVEADPHEPLPALEKERTTKSALRSSDFLKDDSKQAALSNKRSRGSRRRYSKKKRLEQELVSKSGADTRENSESSNSDESDTEYNKSREDKIPNSDVTETAEKAATVRRDKAADAADSMPTKDSKKVNNHSLIHLSRLSHTFLFTLQVEYKMPLEYACLMRNHSSSDHHSYKSVGWYSQAEDINKGRNTAAITTRLCSQLIAYLLNKSFDGWSCGWCPVAIAIRGRWIYYQTVPLAQPESFCDVVLAYWYCRQFDAKNTRGLQEALADLPKLEFPEIINSEAKMSHDFHPNPDHDLGKKIAFLCT